MIPNGTYEAEVVDAELGVTSTGKEQVAVKFNIEGTGTIVWYGYFTEGTVERTLESLEYCGFKGDDISKLDQLKGHKAQIVVEAEEWDGKVRSRVRWVNRIGGPMLKEKMDDTRKTSFAERMKGNLLARRQKKIDSGIDPDGDDIPF